jgi:hypothetical protein
MMMVRNLSQRIRNFEKLVFKAEKSLRLDERKEFQAQFIEDMRARARLHATAVAAIVIHGEPRIDEPLIRAWGRTLRHHRIIVKDEYGREYKYEHGHEEKYKNYERELKIAHAKLYPAIMKGANETEKFGRIFRTAPVWLLEFTWMRADAELLKFDLPEMSDKQVWGEEGLQDFLQWPLLPLGMMTDGDLIPEVPPEHGVPPEHEEHSRQLRRIDDFINRRYGSERWRVMRWASHDLG